MGYLGRGSLVHVYRLLNVQRRIWPALYWVYLLKVQFSSLAIGNLVLLAPHLVLLAPHLVLLAPHTFSSVQLQLGLGRTPAVAENLRVKLGYRTNA